MKKHLARGLAASLAALMPLSLAVHTASPASAAPVSAQDIAGNAQGAGLRWDARFSLGRFLVRRTRMSLFGSTSGFGTGGTSMFGSTTADNHNPMKVRV